VLARPGPASWRGGPRPAGRAAADRRFLRVLQDASDDLTEYLTADRWYQTLTDAPKSIAYFSPEFGITEVLPQYSGASASSPVTTSRRPATSACRSSASGCSTGPGYFVQSLSRDGWQLERYPGLDPHGLPLTELTDPDGSKVRITVGLPGGRELHAQVWKAQVGRVPLLLLDSDIEDNDEAARGVTDRLYGGGTDHRLLQENAARHRRGPRAAGVLRRRPTRRPPRCSTPTRVMPVSLGLERSASW